MRVWNSIIRFDASGCCWSSSTSSYWSLMLVSEPNINPGPPIYKIVASLLSCSPKTFIKAFFKCFKWLRVTSILIPFKACSINVFSPPLIIYSASTPKDTCKLRNCSTSFKASTSFAGIYGGSFLFLAWVKIVIFKFESVKSNFAKKVPSLDSSLIVSSNGANNYLFLSKLPGSNEILNFINILDSLSSIFSSYAFLA